MGERFDNTRSRVVYERPVGPIETGFDVVGNKVVSTTRADGKSGYIVYDRRDHSPIMDEAAKIVRDANWKNFVDDMNA